MANTKMMARFRLRRDPNAARKKRFRVDVSLNGELERSLKMLRFVSGASLNQIINQCVAEMIERRIEDAKNARSEETWDRLMAAFDAAYELSGE